MLVAEEKGKGKRGKERRMSKSKWKAAWLHVSFFFFEAGGWRFSLNGWYSGIDLGFLFLNVFLFLFS